jgi:hypothetical protein
MSYTIDERNPVRFDIARWASGGIILPSVETGSVIEPSRQSEVLVTTVRIFQDTPGNLAKHGVSFARRQPFSAILWRSRFRIRCIRSASSVS